MQDWDSLILYPLLTIVVIVLYVLLLVKRHFKTKKQWFFIIQHFFFWLTLSAILNLNYNFILFTANINWKNLGILVGVSASFYATIFFIPASWITGLLTRRFWFWLSYFTIILGIILALAIPHNQTIFIICALCFGIGIASNSIWYLCFNEVYLYRTNSFLTVALLFPVVIIANFTGLNILNFLKSVNKNYEVDYYILFGLILGFILISFVCCFKLKERKEYIGAFNSQQLKLASKFSWWKVSGILVILFFVGVMREFAQGDFYNFLLAQQTWEIYQNLTYINKYLHLTQEFWWIPQIIAGILLYPVIVKKWGIRNTIFGAFTIWIIYFLVVAFTKIPELWITCQLLSVLAFGIIFVILFSLSMVWNYRVSRRPVTGCFSALNALTTFGAQFVQRAISNAQVGPFKNITLNWNLPVVTNDSYDLSHLHNLVMIIFAVCAGVCLLLMVFVFFTIKHISGEYFSRQNYNFARQILAANLTEQEYDQDVSLTEWLRKDAT
ncbi:hypothetical protein [Spiroplasma eriocheiris]|uniref:Transmembrane protein n=1 Tax=Spiroplasma eriocheiris TaxID=315358 RepID=A0A0H3XM14_9MOLU|nr:hypothetical protein [Spiroplasma eriocheiris]AHF58194.1 putative transmembrane protein [Spiroplasma eriocheiris CCTCC M 207170]AKM54629.1 hypothetical protein SERIO_v1c10760 [Spiroplasma eriocheiris]